MHPPRSYCVQQADQSRDSLWRKSTQLCTEYVRQQITGFTWTESPGSDLQSAWCTGMLCSLQYDRGRAKLVKGEILWYLWVTRWQMETAWNFCLSEIMRCKKEESWGGQPVCSIRIYCMYMNWRLICVLVLYTWFVFAGQNVSYSLNNSYSFVNSALPLPAVQPLSQD